jgi:predicted NBD/HSP70 family sugar kinase
MFLSMKISENPAGTSAMHPTAIAIRECVLQNGAVTRLKIAQTLGLSPRTVALHTNELIRQRHIAVLGHRASTGGRRSEVLGPTAGDQTRCALALIFDHKGFTLHLVDATGKILAEHRNDKVAPFNDALLRHVGKVAVRFVKQHLQLPHRLCGIGMSTRVMSDESTVIDENSWGGELSRYLARRLDVPVYRDVMVRCRTLGERMFGPGQMEPDMVFIGAYQHVEMGIISGGRLVRGSEITESGALGMMRVATPDHAKGLRCLEDFVSINHVVAEIRRKLKAGRSSILVQASRDSIMIEQVMDAYVNGDALAVEQIDEMIYHLIPALHAIQLLLSPRVVIFGSYLRLAGDVLFDHIRRVCQDDPALAGITKWDMRSSGETFDISKRGVAVLALTESYMESSLRAATADDPPQP